MKKYTFLLASIFFFSIVGLRANENKAEDIKNDINNSLRSAYDVFNFDEGQLAGLTHHNEMFWDLLSDDIQKGGDGVADYTPMLDFRKWNGNGAFLNSSAFMVGCAGVSRANDVLRLLNANKASLSETEISRITGEAKFLRAYFNFYLCKLFARVPFIDENATTEDISDAYANPLSPKDIYSKIELDLWDAVSKLLHKNSWQITYGISPNGRATKGAAEAILTRVIAMEIGFGYSSDWQKIYDLSMDIINSGQYSLLPNYASIFELEGQFGSEAVFEIYATDAKQSWGGANGNIMVTMASPRLTVSKKNVQKNIFSGWGFFIPTQSLYNEFEANDPRRENTIIKSGDILYEDGDSITDEQIIIDNGTAQCPTGYFNRKQAIPRSMMPSCGICVNKNKRIVRYSDVLLFAAEAAYNLKKETEARELVNKVRERARKSSAPKGSTLGLADYPASANVNGTLPDITASGNELFNAIAHERRVELALEGIRPWDLIRWGIMKNAISIYVNEDIHISEGQEAICNNYNSHLVDNIVPSLPIPTSIVENNHFPQNPGYGATNINWQQIQDNTLSLFPNPVTDVLNVKTSGSIEQISIYNIDGKRLMDIRSSATTVNVGQLLGGIYIVKVTDNYGTKNFKLIKK